MLHLVRKQAYKLELPARWRIHNIFYVILLEQNFTKKGRINKFPISEFEVSDNKEYEVKAIRDNVVYAKEADGYLPKLYYLVAYKGYLEEENT